jgi:hypothetical protein
MCRIFIAVKLAQLVLKGELEHRRIKRFYARTNKCRAVTQISRLEARKRILERMARKMTDHQMPSAKAGAQKSRMTIGFCDTEPLLKTLPEAHHHISHSRDFHLRIAPWLAGSQRDPLTKVPPINYFGIGILTEFIFLELLW